ncbi:MAG: hypothetical protein Q8S84_01755 [bacterium]|nr:hypothetical protein [bacterium]MDP3380285.1 hypothetical protein [bacterium]
MKSGANFAPQTATGTLSQVLTFAAPHTIGNIQLFTFTVVQFNFSESGCFSHVITSHIYTCSRFSHSIIISSTSAVCITKSLATSSAVLISGI